MPAMSPAHHCRRVGPTYTAGQGEAAYENIDSPLQASAAWLPMLTDSSAGPLGATLWLCDRSLWLQHTQRQHTKHCLLDLHPCCADWKLLKRLTVPAVIESLVHTSRRLLRGTCAKTTM